jgi:hypothetical protein
MAQGTATIDFSTGETSITTTVASAGITGGQLVEAWFFPVATATNTADDTIFDALEIKAHSVNAGVGFSVTATCRDGLAHGSHTFAWVYA